ncbi:oxidoreductase, short-chain dehydrogenase/reductase family, putative [Trichophyton verrucosum HKI 0517]|uniref:Oxidoreductase, short-chain dehydrogenase/reductase family, putative n=1 Tax=Trichophyton verrucosum (strain HKI 0517) TaxID=663202 RepID=D4D112_TRIVH|nr:oxidoreductase, short-chain dehydrogenase/reductase family, putative [Trichophyton verrucosum HKI 0517]EFE44489.1 oxidoreductase, short-chain dehydrogenase/reductase family, putative [Trichophyton verrucosum HKI 0517]
MKNFPVFNVLLCPFYIPYPYLSAKAKDGNSSFTRQPTESYGRDLAFFHLQLTMIMESGSSSELADGEIWRSAVFILATKVKKAYSASRIPAASRLLIHFLYLALANEPFLILTKDGFSKAAEREGGCNNGGIDRHRTSVNHLGLDHEQELISTLKQEVADILASESKKISSSRRLITVAGDVSLPETGTDFIRETVSAFGRLDIFVSNAGICEFKEFLEISPTLFDRTTSVNLSGAFYVTQAAARQMALSQSPPGGSIIGVSSISALVGGGLQAHYTPTKAGILSLMQSSAVALGKFGVRCNALLPGTIRTGLNEEDLKDDKKRTYMEDRVPLGRLGEPKDLAGPAVFLACDELSGYVLLVDGGMFVNLQ